ncbi:MAG: methyltransferase domain-containing protein [Chloroflexota bacterium]
MAAKSIWQTSWDFIGIPFRLVLFDQEWLPRFGWTTLEEERITATMPHITGRLLDVGSGTNTLVNTYGDGVGVDVFDWGNGTVVVENSAELPFADESFDTVTFIACLNHIPYRDSALAEAHRLIKPDGKLLITMINPLLGDFGHAIWWYSEDKKRGGMIEGELGGMWMKDIVALCEDAGFRLVKHERFVYAMNNLYVFEPVT